MSVHIYTWHVCMQHDSFTRVHDTVTCVCGCVCLLYVCICVCVRLYACAFVCMRMCVCTYLWVSVWSNVCASMYFVPVCWFVFLPVCLCVPVSLFSVQMCECACVCIVYMSSWMFVCFYAAVRLSVYIVCEYIYIHTRKQINI